MNGRTLGFVHRLKVERHDEQYHMIVLLNNVHLNDHPPGFLNLLALHVNEVANQDVAFLRFLYPIEVFPSPRIKFASSHLYTCVQREEP